MAHKTIGELMTPARERLGLSVSECARKVGITPFYWHQIEKNRQVPSEDVLKSVSRALCLDYSSLCKARDQMKKEKSATKEAEKKVVMWMRQNKVDPRVVLEQLRGTTWKA